MSSGPEGQLERVLAEPVYTGSEYKPFAELTVVEVEARAAELRAAAEGPMQARVAPVAAVWEGLAAAMRTAGAATVAEHERADLAARSDRLWVVPPGGSFL